MTTPEQKPFNPMATARMNLKEMNAGRVVPTAPVVAAVVAGSPVAVLVVNAINESGGHVGPSGSALIGIAISAALSYFTRGGRRQLGARK